MRAAAAAGTGGADNTIILIMMMARGTDTMPACTMSITTGMTAAFGTAGRTSRSISLEIVIME